MIVVFAQAGNTEYIFNQFLDCDGVCFGSAVLDECGICNGDGIVDGACDRDGNVDLGCGCGELVAEENFDCDGACIVDTDCAGVCGG